MDFRCAGQVMGPKHMGFVLFSLRHTEDGLITNDSRKFQAHVGSHEIFWSQARNSSQSQRQPWTLAAGISPRSSPVRIRPSKLVLDRQAS